jgi:uncharacterized protein YbjT (DUF2867 family)
MHRELVVVVGATGNVGSRLTELLLEARRRVRVVARNEERLRPFGDAGAEVVVGSVEDPAVAQRAFAGAHEVFTMLPPLIEAENLRARQNRVSQALVDGLAAARVAYVVNLSSWGAEVPFGSGPIAGLHDHEERLDQLEATHVIHLRAASFMENFLGAVPMIQSQGALMGVVRGDLPVPMIATQDIAEEAFRRLAALDFEGKSTQELLGPRDYTFTEAAAILGGAVGKPELPYVVIPEHQLHMALVATGLPAHMADIFLEMYRAIESGKIHAAEPRLPENTTPTTLGDWASTVFAPRFRHAGA